jgi:RHS repeat-associated protein
VSNESPVDVFFDNLQVIHTRGAILEETHYYPFGLTMAGISSKALNNAPENKYKYNGIEQNNDFDLNIYDAFYRNLDPQIGRWWQIDPKPNDSESPYAAMGNNPISHSDFLGDTLTPEQTKLFLVAPSSKDGDQKGVITNATKEEYQQNPIKALGKDILHFAAEFLGFNAIDDATATVIDPNASTEDKVVGVVNAGLSTGVGKGSVEIIPDNAIVVRGGTNTPELIRQGTDTHPEGPTGVSVEYGNCSVQELSKPLPHGQIGVTTVEQVRNSGGDVIRTSGKP